MRTIFKDLAIRYIVSTSIYRIVGLSYRADQYRYLTTLFFKSITIIFISFVFFVKNKYLYVIIRFNRTRVFMSNTETELLYFS